VLATLIDDSGMKVTVSVDEVDITKVKLGQKAVVTLDALPDKTFAGEVTEIAAKGTESNGVASFDVIVSLDRSEELKENMTANVEIITAQKENVLLLPVEAVQERQGQKFVLMATNRDTDSGKQAHTMTRVETGLYNDTMIEITSGLKAGDVVSLPGTMNTGTSPGSTGNEGRSGGRTGEIRINNGGMPGGGMPRM
jgi:HlyD family secretion protein